MFVRLTMVSFQTGKIFDAFEKNLRIRLISRSLLLFILLLSFFPFIRVFLTAFSQRCNSSRVEVKP